MTVLFCGENPGFTLFHARTNETVAVVSYWVSRDSVFGRGSALIVQTKDFQAVLTDNPAMALGLNQRFTQHFPEFSDCGVPQKILQANLSQTWHSDNLSVRAIAPNFEIEAHWSEVLDRRVSTWADFPGTNCDLSNVIMPCAGASLRINGVQVLGSVQTDGRRSSAFLALCEVWLERSASGF